MYQLPRIPCTFYLYEQNNELQEIQRADGKPLGLDTFLLQGDLFGHHAYPLDSLLLLWRSTKEVEVTNCKKQGVGQPVEIKTMGVFQS